MTMLRKLKGDSPEQAMSSKVNIEIAGKKYTGEGETLQEALSSIDYGGFAGLISKLTVGDKTVVLRPQQTMRLFAKQPMMKEIAVKNTALRFE